jgi:hypothetical protein
MLRAAQTRTAVSLSSERLQRGFSISTIYHDGVEAVIALITRDPHAEGAA